MRSQTETDLVITELFQGSAGQAAIGDMDAAVQTLPGMTDLRLFADACSAALARRAAGHTRPLPAAALIPHR